MNEWKLMGILMRYAKIFVIDNMTIKIIQILNSLIS